MFAIRRQRNRVELWIETLLRLVLGITKILMAVTAIFVPIFISKK